MSSSNLTGPLAGVANLAGGIIGNSEASGNQDADTAAKQAALAAMMGVSVPDIQEQMLNLQQEQVAGQLNPNMEGTVQQGNSAMQNISTDPRLKQAQMTALASLQQQGQGGLTDAEKSALIGINNNASGNAQAASQAVMQQMAARGMGGGGAQLAAQLAAAQGAANQSATAGQSMAGLAQQNALAAMANAGNLGSTMQSQSFNQQAAQAQAQDAINRFNAANQQQVLGTNTGAQNQAQYANLQNAQNVANANTTIANQQQAHNKGLYQSQFNNQMTQASGVANAQNNYGNYQGNLANQTRGEWSGIGQGVGDTINSTNPSGGGSGGGGAGGGGAASSPTDSMGSASSLQMPSFGEYTGGEIPQKYASGGDISAYSVPQSSISLSSNVDNTPLTTGFEALVAADAKKAMQAQQAQNSKGKGNKSSGSPSSTTPDASTDNGLSSILANMGSANNLQQPTLGGNTTPLYADGGDVGYGDPSAPLMLSSNTGDTPLSNGFEALEARDKVPQGGGGGGGGGSSSMMSMLPMLAMLAAAHGGEVPSPNQEANDYTKGAYVPGKAKVKGDSPENDTVLAKVSPGEVVIPRTIAQHDDPDVIHAFIKGVLAHKKHQK